MQCWTETTGLANLSLSKPLFITRGMNMFDLTGLQTLMDNFSPLRIFDLLRIVINYLDESITAILGLVML
jgi:hypothetical protein